MKRPGRAGARWRGIGTLDKEMAFASDRVILTCEEIISEAELRRQPESNQVPYFVVDCIVQVNYGAYPSGTPYFYDYDAKFIQAMNQTSRSAEDLKKWLDEWVFEPANWEVFLFQTPWLDGRRHPRPNDPQRP